VKGKEEEGMNGRTDTAPFMYISWNESAAILAREAALTWIIEAAAKCYKNTQMVMDGSAWPCGSTAIQSAYPVFNGRRR